MKELLVLLALSLGIFITVWMVIFGLYFLMAGLLWNAGKQYVIVGGILIIVALGLAIYMGLYMKGRTSQLKEILKKIARR